MDIDEAAPRGDEHIRENRFIIRASSSYTRLCPSKAITPSTHEQRHGNLVDNLSHDQHSGDHSHESKGHDYG